MNDPFIVGLSKKYWVPCENMKYYFILFEITRMHYTPLVTPFVERQPCHSLNSLLWQHSPSGPMAVQVNKQKVTMRRGDKEQSWK